MLTIRRATIDDIDQIQHLAEELFTATYHTILSPEQLDYMLRWMYSTPTLRGEMEAGFAWFIAEHEGTACGYLSIQQETEELFHLQKIYLHSKLQGTGAGRQLFEQALTYIHTVHPTPCRMELNVNRNNPALGFYERMGMQRLREGDFPIGNGFYMHDYIMGLTLSQL